MQQDVMRLYQNSNSGTEFWPLSPEDAKHRNIWLSKINSAKKVKEADLYSAFIEVPHTQGAQVRITQCYQQTTPYLPLPRKHSPDGASQTEVADI